MRGPIKNVIFDCDGTILDTFKLIEQVVIETFKIIEPSYHMTEEEAHTFFGPFLNDTFKKYFNNQEAVDNAVEVYRKLCEELTPKYVRAYDGIKEMLIVLKQKGYKIAMVSNKVTKAIIQGLDLCNITNYFDYIVGAEKLKQAKPNPDGIYQVLDYFNAPDTTLVGDTLIDMNTAINAKVTFIGVTWCQVSEEKFKSHGAKFVVNNPLDIVTILEKKYELCK